jgi:hypothetical protein
VVQRPTLARFVAEGPAAPRYEGDTQVQGESVDETDPAHLMRDVHVRLGRVGGCLLEGRESRLHDGVLCGTGRDESHTGMPRFATEGCAESQMSAPQWVVDETQSELCWSGFESVTTA